MASSWVRGNCIGKGAFGIVNVAVSKSDGGISAVKSVDRKTGLPGQLEALENEIRVLNRVSSPHVVAFLGDDVTCEGTSSFRNLHLEYMPGGTVADMDYAHVDEQLVRRLAWCVVDALRHVHALNVVHCDVKGRNVLIAGNGDAGGSVAKLADFGSAVEFTGGECSVLRGTPLWMAPEVIRREYQGPESDVWSLGCTVIEMFTGKSPWKDRSVDTLTLIGYSDDLPEFPSGLSELGRDFLEKCLRRDWNQRWRCDQLLQHPFLLPNDSIVVESSPRCVLNWVDSRFAESENECEEEEEEEVNVKLNSEENLVKNRIGKLETGPRVNWETEDWVMVRAIASDEEVITMENEMCGGEERGTIWEFENVMRAEEEVEVGSELEYMVSGERVNWEMWRLVWRRMCDQCNRKDSSIAGSGCGLRCRYEYGWEKLDRIIVGIFIICALCCKLFKSLYLFSIKCRFRLKRLLDRCLCRFRFRFIISSYGYILNINVFNFRRIDFKGLDFKRTIGNNTLKIYLVFIE